MSFSRGVCTVQRLRDWSGSKLQLAVTLTHTVTVTVIILILSPQRPRWVGGLNPIHRLRDAFDVLFLYCCCFVFLNCLGFDFCWADVAVLRIARPAMPPLARRCPGAKGLVSDAAAEGASLPSPSTDMARLLASEATLNAPLMGDATESAMSPRARPGAAARASSLLRSIDWLAIRILASRLLIFVHAARPKERSCIRSWSWNRGHSRRGNFWCISTNSSNVITPLASVSNLRSRDAWREGHVERSQHPERGNMGEGSKRARGARESSWQTRGCTYPAHISSACLKLPGKSGRSWFTIRSI